MSDPVVRSGPEDEDVVVVRLNRPHVLNALNVELLESLVGALRDCRDACAVVLEAEGRAFCVGEDLNETLAPQGGGADELRSSFELLQETTRLVTSLPCPVVAVVDGYAIGGGAELALACDLVVAGRGARFRFPEVVLGHSVTGGITARLPAIAGLLVAKELLLTGRWVDAEEAVRLRLVNELVDEPSRRARELAADLVGNPSRSSTGTKQLLENAAVPHQHIALQSELDMASWCFAAEDAAASIAAFRERRGKGRQS